MKNFLDMDSPVVRFFNRMADLFILNILVLLLCIPVITAGAAFTAMHYVLLKMVRDEEGYLVRGFFKSFKQNFKQATALWLLMLVAAGIFIGDYYIFSTQAMTLPTALEVIIFAFGFFIALMSTYIFPLLARFENTIKNTIKNACFMTFINFPKTLLMLIVYAIPLVALYFYIGYAMIFVILYGVSVPAYIAAFLYSKTFKRFEPESQETSDLDFTIGTEDEREEDRNPS